MSVAAEGANPSADTAAPTPGTLSVRSVGLETAVIEWTGAADNVTAAADLEYRLFCSESDNISTAAEAETNGTAMGSGYAAGITYETATGLAQTTAYYFTVVVRDEAGNKAAYTPVQQGTRVSVIENNPSSNTDRITAVAAEGPYVYLAGYDYDGTTGFDWRIEKRRLDTGALVAGFGTDGVVRDGLTNEDRPTSMAVYGDWLIVSGGDMSASNYEWRTRIYDKEDGSVVMGKTINPSTGEDRIEGIVVDGDYLFLAGRQYDAANGDWEMRLEKRALDTLDLVSAFGSGGVVTDDPYETTNDYYTAIAVDDSYVYVAGRTKGYLDTNICVDKYDKTTGAPDTSFGTSGRVELGSLTGYYSEGAAGIVVSGGYIYLLGGYCYTNGASPYEWNYLMLYRLDAADGSVDTVFAGGSDYITINPDGTSALTENPLAADGKYLFLVTSTNNSESADNQWYVEKRSLSSGEIPSLFNGGQPVFINYSTGAAVYENPNAVCVDDLNIFVGGSMYAADGEEWYLRILDKETGE